MIEEEVQNTQNEVPERSLTTSKKILAPVTEGFAESVAKQNEQQKQASEASYIPQAPAVPYVSADPTQSTYAELHPVQPGMNVNQAAATALIERKRPKRPLGIWIFSILRFILLLIALPRGLNNGVTLAFLVVDLLIVIGLFFGINALRILMMVLIGLSLALTLPFISILLVSPSALLGVIINLILFFYLRSQGVKDFFER